MFRSTAQVRIIALFVVAFLCLNAGGAMCVAYCQTFDMAEESSEHCPLKKTFEDCDGHHKLASDSAAVVGHELDCCPMTVSFFAGPIEKRSFSFDAAAEIVEPTPSFVVPQFSNPTVVGHAPHYRGPPLDRRMNRLKNCLIRI